MGFEEENGGPLYQSLTDNKTYVVQPSAPFLNFTKSNDTILVKAKYEKRYKQFVMPASYGVDELTACIKENFRIEHQYGASAGVAYLVWLFFGFFGIHRFYLRKHNATSFILWFLTGQLFGLGWLYDGATLWYQVDDYNKKQLNPNKYEEGEGFLHLLFGYKNTERPSMVGAYLLWFFFGWFGVHRWYTNHCTLSSYVAWLFTGQMFGLGWMYDGYYTSQMVNKYRPSVAQPFFIKAYDGQQDYVPVNTTEEVQAFVNRSFSNEDRTLRLMVVQKKKESIAYTLWLIFGIFGAHAWYLGMNPSTYITRFFTGNFFGIGYLVDGINLDSLIEEANEKLAGEFIPSCKGRKIWPLEKVVIVV